MKVSSHSSKHTQFKVWPIGITGRIAGLIFVTVILPMTVTGLFIEYGELEPGNNHYLAIPFVLLFLLIPISRMLARYMINSDLATVNDYLDELKNGNYDVSFQLGNQKEDEDEFILLLRNLTWVSHNLVARNESNKKTLQETKKSLNEMERMAFTDPLTGLFNRRYLKHLNECYYCKNDDCSSSDSSSPTSLIYIDCDKFKQINDAKGHIFGDQILVGLAKCLNKACRHEQDVPFRMGGDEFAVLLSETTTEQAKVVGQRINDMYHKMDCTEGTSLSIGIASVTHTEQRSDSLDILIDFADQQAYAAKRSGGGVIKVTDDAKLCPLGA